MIRQWSARPRHALAGRRRRSAMPSTRPRSSCSTTTGEPAQDEGEIAVIARTLAVGYWKDPGADRGGVSPGRRAGRDVRMYRTGDLGRLLPDGCLLHAGRKDARLKIRGHRVEIGEVEAALLAVAGRARSGRWTAVEPRRGLAPGRVGRAGSPERPPSIAATRDAVAPERLPASHGAVAPSSFSTRCRARRPERSTARPCPTAATPRRPGLATPFASARRKPAEAAVAARLRAGARARPRRGRRRLLRARRRLALGRRGARRALGALGIELSAADLLEAPTPAALAARIALRGPAAPDALVRIQAAPRRARLRGSGRRGRRRGPLRRAARSRG